jgi:hypothetical protein
MLTHIHFKGASMRTFKSCLFISVLALMFTPLAFAQYGGGNDPTSQLLIAMQNLCSSLHTLVPVAAMLMVMFASVVYATGQMMGAETRARANVWATSALTGALIGILISVVAPAVLGMIANDTINCDGS